MKIVFTGGGTGGHFYPIIAVAEAIKQEIKIRKIIEPEMFFFGPTPYDERALFEHGIVFVKTPAGKMRRYFSFLNFFDLFKTAWGIFETIVALYRVYPDVVFAKGGYGSVPTIIAARILHIPLIIHDSDAIPGRATLMAAAHAVKIALAFEEAKEYFSQAQQQKVALTGTPIRTELRQPSKEGSHEFLELEDTVPVILILGGSSGATSINETVLGALPLLVDKYQIIHQTGTLLLKDVEQTAKVILEDNPLRYRYKVFGSLSPLALKMAAGVSDIVVSRAGGGTIAEIALWGIPSILVPIPQSVSRDQRLNAFAYARYGAAVVIEQNNFTPNLLLSEIDRLFHNQTLRDEMKKAAQKFSHKDSATILATAILDTALEHET